jgi:hypothetical protein
MLFMNFRDIQRMLYPLSKTSIQIGGNKLIDIGSMNQWIIHRWTAMLFSAC